MGLKKEKEIKVSLTRKEIASIRWALLYYNENPPSKKMEACLSTDERLDLHRKLIKLEVIEG